MLDLIEKIRAGVEPELCEEILAEFDRQREERLALEGKYSRIRVAYEALFRGVKLLSIMKDCSEQLIENDCPF